MLGAGMLYARELPGTGSADLAAPDIVVSGPTENEVIKEVERIVQEVLKLMEEITTELKLVKDKATADAHARKINELLGGLMGLLAQADEMEEQGVVDVRLLNATVEKYKEKGEAIGEAMENEMDRTADADFYGSEALKKVAEDSYIFPMSAPIPPPPPVVVPVPDLEEDEEP